MRALRRPLAAGAIVVALAAPGFAQTPSSSCGETTTIAPADTLSRIAERCDVSETAILRLNPRVQGSDDLQVGSAVKVAGDAVTLENTTDRLQSYARGAGEALSGMARDVGSSVDELLDKNPDLRQRIQRWSDRLGVAGPEAPRDSEPKKPQVSVAPASGAAGEMVTVTASGLPANTAVNVGGGPPRAAYELLAQAKTDADGRLSTTVRSPASAGERDRFVIVIVGPDQAWRARAEPYRVSGARL